ncbi:ATP-binding protein [Marinicella rhabdoformis]|uniref:ATP-binding protein n=1 Tax=Marinicella rhabdoformis TaxID=2580566 RepID=UPI0012AEBF9A|nr:ATP-binding protein [Marinicella rhabdoformis]
MKLRWQISIIALLSLSFPLLAWYAFKQLNQTYQEGMVVAAQKQADVIKQSVVQYANNNPAGIEGLVYEQLTSGEIDGNDAEWQTLAWHVVDYKLRFKIAQINDQWRMLIEGKDNSPQMATDNSLDRIVLALADQHSIKKLTIARQAVGQVFTPSVSSALQAYWHETAGGYQVEVALPVQQLSRIGLVLIDHNQALTPLTHGHTQGQQITLHPLFEASSSWQSFLESIKPSDGQVVIKDHKSRLLYQTTPAKQTLKDSDWLSQFLYELVFDQDATDESFFYGQQIIHELPFGKIETTLVQADAQIALMQTFLRVMGMLLLAALLLLGGSFLYAALLVWRIKKLNHSLQNALDDQGQIHTHLPAINSSDEIGDLSRGMSQLLGRINEYTAYLKQLGGRLSHEMKTPISIVHTSLEVLHMKQPEDEFISRALNANNRLKFILNQLSALSKLKQIIAETEVEVFEINGFLKELTEAYRINHPVIQFESYEGEIHMKASKDLLAQMLDKLIQNALDYIGPDDHILIRTAKDNKTNNFLLTVTNSGSQIAPQHLGQLFDSLTSFRKEKSEQPHLGLGLYIVKLICDFHQSEITAINLNKPKSVQFRIKGKISN